MRADVQHNPISDVRCTVALEQRVADPSGPTVKPAQEARVPLRLARCLLGVALTAVTLGATGATSVAAAADQAPAATAPVSTQDALTAAQARLAAANDAIAQVAVRLQDGTARWQAGVDALGASQSATVQAQQAAEQAATAAHRSQRVFEDVVASEYQSPQLPPAVLVLSGGVTSALDAVRAGQDLQRVRGSWQDALAAARDERAQAEQMAAQARRRRDADAAQARTLAGQVADLQALAEQTNVQVQAATADVDRLQAQRDAEIAAEAAAELARQQAAEAVRRAALAAQHTAAQQRAAAAARPSAPAGPAPGGAGACAGRSVSGYANGNIPVSALCPLRYAPGQVLRADAAAAFNQLTDAYLAARGTPICVTDSYRNYATQVELYRTKPSLAAVPGTSNHGWGVAVDLCGGIQDYGTGAYSWMKANAPRFGWVHPAWAEPGSSREEPWHWEYTG